MTEQHCGSFGHAPSLSGVSLGFKMISLAAVCMLGLACSGSSTPQTGAGGGGGNIKATCSQLTAADVQALMTSPVAGVDATVVGTDGDGQQCIFHDADSEQAIDIIVVPASDVVLGYDAAKRQSSNPVALVGIGDQSFRETGDLDPYAEHGGLMCTVSLSEAIEIPGVDALVVNGSLHLSEAQNGIIATALGTICNRIFGSGNTTPDLSGL